MNDTVNEQAIIELLPWYANGTLSVDERAQVEQALAGSAAVREALASIRLLQDNLPPADTFPAAELGWKRLQKQLRAERQSVAKPAAWWNKAAAIAAMVMVAVQVGWFAVTGLPQQDAGNDIRLLGSSAIVVGEQQVLIQLQLSGNTPWQEVVHSLSPLGADIVQGPSALGVVRIRITLGQAMIGGEPVTDPQAVVDWLLSQAGVEHAALEDAR